MAGSGQDASPELEWARHSLSSHESILAQYEHLVAGHRLARGQVARHARAHILQMARSLRYSVCSNNRGRRLNTKLEEGGYPPMSSLVQDLSDGVKLIQLMVSLAS